MVCPTFNQSATGLPVCQITSTEKSIMKTNTKLTILAVIAAVGTASAFADDPQLRNRMDVRLQKMDRNEASPTVAVYANRHGLQQREMARGNRMENQTETRYEIRTNAHGQTFAAPVPNS